MSRKIFVINIIFLLILLTIYICFYKEDSKDNKIAKAVIEQEFSESDESAEDNQVFTQESNNENKIEIINEYKGYDVGAKLEIPEINLETYVLKNYSESALNISVTKFWGADANEIGNFCVVGHNFINKNMFHNLRDLKLGDRIFVLDNKIGKIEYEIYDLYQVYPEDVRCLSQKTGGLREITLITCTNDSKKRIIVKAKELKDDKRRE